MSISIGEPGFPELDDELDRPEPVAPAAGTDEPGGDPDPDAPLASELTVRMLVRGLVEGGVGFILKDPDVPDHWKFADDELEALIPPLTRVINKHEPLRRAVARGDELVVLITLSRYVGRNFADGRRAAHVRGQASAGAAGPVTLTPVDGSPGGEPQGENPAAPVAGDGQPSPYGGGGLAGAGADAGFVPAAVRAGVD